MKIYLSFFLFLFAFSTLGQSTAKIDSVVGDIYNLDFKNIQNQINELKKSDPEMAGYLELDYLWWKMISDYSALTEINFLSGKNAFLSSQNRNDKDFKTVIYYLYQIRYENFKKSGLSKYFSAMKCQIYLQKLDESKLEVLTPLEQDLFRLIVEFDKCLKYKLISDITFFKSKENQVTSSGLKKIENLQSKDCRSFDTIKDYLLGKIYLEIVHDTVKAFDKFSKLSDNYPANIVFKEIIQQCSIGGGSKRISNGE